MSIDRSNRSAYLASLRNKVQEMSFPKGSTQQRQNDDRYWKLDVDKTGTGSAIIRFLPAKASEAFPFVQLWSHGFQGPTGKWLIDSCPSSLGGVPSDVCPVCAANNELWNASSDKEDYRKGIARDRKRKLNYISNILVVNDPKHAENNGKVFLYKYGKKIFEKIKDMIDPPAEFADMQPLDPFDMQEGANFKLRQVKVDGFPNYDKSSFDSATSIGDDALQTQIQSQLFSLEELLNAKYFKSYADLEKRLILAVGDEQDGTDGATTGDAKPTLGGDDDMPTAKPKTSKTSKPKATAKAPEATSSDSEEDYFAKLASQA